MIHTSFNARVSRRARGLSVIGVAQLAMLLSPLVLSASLLHAQVASPTVTRTLSEGSRVRVTPTYRQPQLDAESVVGEIRQVTRDSLSIVWGEAQTLTLGLAQIARLDVRQGTRTNGKRGMLFGLLAGATAGVVLGLADGGDGYFSADELALGAGVVLGTLGAAAGGVIGLVVRTDNWQPVDVAALARGTQVGPVMVDGRLSLGLRLRW